MSDLSELAEKKRVSKISPFELSRRNKKPLLGPVLLYKSPKVPLPLVPLRLRAL